MDTGFAGRKIAEILTDFKVFCRCAEKIYGAQTCMAIFQCFHRDIGEEDCSPSRRIRSARVNWVR